MNDCTPIPCNCKDGKKGISGLNGVAGNAGANGITGVVGPQGPQGLIGTTGGIGVTGIQGIPGTDGTVPIVGPTGPDGPQGLQGLQGLPGNDGNDGAAGARGNDAIDALFIEIDAQGGALLPSIATHNVAVNQIHIIRNTGIRWLRLPGSWNAIVPVVGDIVNLYGSIATAEWQVEVMQNQRVQMNGAQSNVGFNTIVGGNPSNPGSPLLQLAPTNYKDCFTFLYIGGQEWLVIKANLAGGLLPTLT